MAGSVNRAIILGRVGRDPEPRTFPSGDRIVNFSIATEESWRDRASGERKSKTTWHNVSCLNDGIGKIVEQYVRKGSLVFIEGQIQNREWTDKDGNKRTSTEIVIPKFGGTLTLVGDKKDEGTRTAGPGRSLSDEIGDDIPFAPEWR